MSWYLANEKGIIDQFASGKGFADLRAAAAHAPALKDFFDEGATKNILLCVMELDKLAKSAAAPDVRETAKGLAALLRGQTLVSVTQGAG